MLRRAAVVFLGAAVLCGSGMPLRLPCCSLRKLESPALQADCCPIPGCTLAEKAGPAAAAIRERCALGAPSPASPLPATMRVRLVSVASFARVLPSVSPPRGGPPLSLLSVYRI
ncbi:MAG TPA: hypothetical protein VFL12_11095 [Thermoanaerobaculia bacterium]|nr:hypothetical protein [Thermoanaerobaculia bacterium]